MYMMYLEKRNVFLAIGGEKLSECQRKYTEASSIKIISTQNIFFMKVNLY